MQIIKRSGSEDKFSKTHIINAINNASQKVAIEQRFTSDEIKEIAKTIEERAKNETHIVNTGDIQRWVEDAIILANKCDIAREYITFRYQKQLSSQKNTIDDNVLSLIANDNELLKQENANKNPTIMNVQRDYTAGEVSKDISRRYLIPQDIYQAHKDGIIHFHDMDYFIHPMNNCCLVNLEDMLQNGTKINNVLIEKPHRFSTAATIASQIAQQVSSSQYGGQTMYVSDLSPFVEETRKDIRKRLISAGIDPTDDMVEKMTILDIEDGVQTFMYQLNTMSGTNGQTPFISLYMDLSMVEEGKEREDLALVIQKILERRIIGFKNANGVYVAPAFPKLLFVLDEMNVPKDSKYNWLKKLAGECTIKRMVPDYISAKKMREYKDGNVYGCMGCRSFLTVGYVDKNDPWKMTTKKKGVPKFKGRFNQGVVTINLPDVALSSKGNIEKFWYILNDRLDLCHRALRLRHERLRGVKSDVAPILWQDGAFARLEAGESIDKLLYNGYSTISLGYVGLYETVKYLTGKDHWVDDDEGGALSLAKEIMQKLNDACARWKEVEHIDYSLYGTPEESTTGKFAEALQRRFGIIKGITDKNYVTNSYHVPVFQEINAFDKIDAESKLQKLSPGGAISYIEAPNMENNPEAIDALLDYFYDNIMYAEINLKLDTCGECGYQGAFEIIEENGKLQFKCPNCGEKEFTHTPTRLRPCRRVCGYISSNQMNQGRMGDIKDRVEHI